MIFFGNFSSPLRNVQNSLELKLSLNREVLDGKMIFPVVGQALVESAVFLGGDVLRITSPDRLGLVQLLVGNLLLLDRFLLLFLTLLVLIDFLDLGLLRLFTVLDFFVVLNLL